MSYFQIKRGHKQTLRPVEVGVHHVSGDLDGIEFLRNGDQKYIDSLFWFAKRYGFSEYTYEDETYVLRRKKDISYEVQQKSDEAEQFIREFR